MNMDAAVKFDLEFQRRTKMKPNRSTLAKFGLALFLFLSGCQHGCDGANAQDCGWACTRAGRPMLKYNQADGCVCQAPGDHP